MTRPELTDGSQSIGMLPVARFGDATYGARKPTTSTEDEEPARFRFSPIARRALTRNTLGKTSATNSNEGLLQQDGHERRQAQTFASQL